MEANFYLFLSGAGGSLFLQGQASTAYDAVSSISERGGLKGLLSSSIYIALFLTKSSTSRYTERFTTQALIRPNYY